jgi:hypothetical protein
MQDQKKHLESITVFSGIGWLYVPKRLVILPHLFRFSGELNVSGIEFSGDEMEDRIGTLLLPGITMLLCIISIGRKRPERKMPRGSHL